jgi:2-phospho-L-lactate guanylyltransferase
MTTAAPRAVHLGPSAEPVSTEQRPSGKSWTVVLPLKGGSNAKSRLGAPAPLATAIALDCLAAVLASDRVGEVVVVTADPLMAGRAAAAGARVQPESVPGRGLPAAISDGLAAVQGRCAVLLGDLPALRPDDLSTALRRAGELLTGELLASNPDPSTPDSRPAMAFVPDAEGTGTVLLAALTPAALAPAFGPDSAAAHAAAGAARLDLDLPRLRRDVDTRDDLRTAIALGIGPLTREVLAEITV